MKKNFLTILKHNIWVCVGAFLGLGIMDLIRKNAFQWEEWVTRIVVIMLMNLLFSFIEYKFQKK